MSRQRVYLVAFAVWLGFLVLAFGQGAVRERLHVPAFGEQAAHVVGILAFVGGMLIVMAAFVRRIRLRCSSADLWLVGLPMCQSAWPAWALSNVVRSGPGVLVVPP